MILSILCVVALAATSLHMLQTAKGKLARRLALLPLMMCVCEFIVMGVVDAWAFPVLTLGLMACRVSVIAVCSLVLKRDARLTRAHSRARQQLRRRLSDALNEQPEEEKILAFRRCA